MGSATAVLVTAAAGLLSGSYTTPMRFVNGWKQEHTWLVYALWGGGILPWINAFAVCPDTWSVYTSVDPKVIGAVLGLSLLWGIGTVLFGLAVKYVGNSVAFAVILGIGSSLGSAMPLLIFHMDEATQKVGIFIWISLAMVALGLVFLGSAGYFKERDQMRALEEKTRLLISEIEVTHDPTLQMPGPPPKRRFVRGITVAVFAGVFSACLNLALSYGAVITKSAQCSSRSVSQNALWPLAVCGGVVMNLPYSGWKITKARSWHFLWRGPHVLWNHFMCFLMAVLWFESNVIYGVGTYLLGSQLGLVLGWPVYLSAQILTANIAGVVLGEWKGTRRKARLLMAIGVIIVIGAIVVVAEA